jgi:hypothetical protein
MNAILGDRPLFALFARPTRTMPSHGLYGCP